MTSNPSSRIGDREGHRISVTSINRNLDAKPGSDSMSFGLDFSTAPVPPRRYAADICDVFIHRNEFLIIFGQEAVFGGGLDSVLQARMNPTAAADFLRSMANTDDPSIDDLMKANELELEPLTSLIEAPSREAKVVVNFASVAVSGFETCMDFYHASPFAYRHLAG